MKDKNVRGRPHIICIRMTEDEYGLLTKKMAAADDRCSRSEWIRRRIFAENETVPISKIHDELKKLRVETYFLQHRLADHPKENDDAMQLMYRCGDAMTDIEKYIGEDHGGNSTKTS